MGIKTLVPTIFVATALQLVSLDIAFFHHQPKNLRGALSGTRILFSNLITILFIYYAGFQFDNVSKNAPFYICGGCDVLFGLWVAVLALYGKIKF
jgi:hypothetical protein